MYLRLINVNRCCFNKIKISTGHRHNGQDDTVNIQILSEISCMFARGRRVSMICLQSVCFFQHAGGILDLKRALAEAIGQ